MTKTEKEKAEQRLTAIENEAAEIRKLLEKPEREDRCGDVWVDKYRKGFSVRDSSEWVYTSCVGSFVENSFIPNENTDRRYLGNIFDMARGKDVLTREQFRERVKAYKCPSDGTTWEGRFSLMLARSINCESREEALARLEKHFFEA